MKQHNSPTTIKKEYSIIQEVKNEWNRSPAGKFTVLACAIALAGAAYIMGMSIGILYSLDDLEKQVKYAESHLEPDAVLFSELPFNSSNSYYGTCKDYKDADNNGRYESFLVWNCQSQNTKVELPIKRSADDNIVFPSISDTAVTPIEVLDLPHAIRDIPDYKDINGDGKLESIVYGEWGQKQPMILELIDGKYTISNP